MGNVRGSLLHGKSSEKLPLIVIWKGLVVLAAIGKCKKQCKEKSVDDVIFCTCGWLVRVVNERVKCYGPTSGPVGWCKPSINEVLYLCLKAEKSLLSQETLCFTAMFSCQYFCHMQTLRIWILAWLMI